MKITYQPGRSVFHTQTILAAVARSRRYNEIVTVSVPVEHVEEAVALLGEQSDEHDSVRYEDVVECWGWSAGETDDSRMDWRVHLHADQTT